jgi:hypothetical protein
LGLEITPASVASDGNLRVTFLPAVGNPKSAAVLNGETAKALTYSLTPAGFNRSITEETVNDERLTLRQLLTRAGTSTQGLELQYVFGGDDEVARPTLKEGTVGFIVARYSVPNETDYAAAQEVDIIPIQAGKQRKDAPTRNGMQTLTQAFYVTGIVLEDEPLAA